MTDIQTILKMPDSDIARSGIFVKQIFDDYKRISGQTPQFCDCQLKKYIKFLNNIMASIKLGASTTINITIPLPEAVTKYENIIASIYTNQCSPVKFSYVTKSGFNKLDIGNATNQLVGKLTSAQSALMRGELYMVLKVIDEVGALEDIGDSEPTLIGIELIDNNLKNVI